MARKRMIDPAIWDDEDVGVLSDGAFRVFIACISNADDEGRLRISPSIIRRWAFGYKTISDSKVAGYMAELFNTLRSFHVYSNNGKTYCALLNWRKYQIVNRATPSLCPAPDDDGSEAILSPFSEHSVSTHGAFSEDSVSTHGAFSEDSCEKKERKERREGSNRRNRSTCRVNATTSANASESYSPDFEAFWSAYPRHVEKASAWRVWKTRLKDGHNPQRLIDAARNYAQECQATNRDPTFIKHAATFLGPDKPFEDYSGGNHATSSSISRPVRASHGGWSGPLTVETILADSDADPGE